jgi:glutamine amidotransferase
MFPFEAPDQRSDTALFVGEMLPRLGARWFDDPYLFHLVEAYCDTGYTNKLVVVTSDSKADERAYLVNERAGNWNAAKTIWFSNRSHEARKTKTATVNSWVNLPNEDWNACGVDTDDDGWTRCDFCAEPGVAYLDETGTLVCHICGSCSACGNEWDFCDCFGPVHRRTDAQMALSEM